MKTPTPSVRPLRVTDARALGDFLTACEADRPTAWFFHPHPLTRRYAADLCQRIGRGKVKDRYFVLAVGDRVAGYGMLRGWDEGYHVPSYGVCVHPRARDAAAGHALTAYAIREARRAGAKALRLTVYKANERAARLYERYGFRFADQDAGRRVGTLDLTPRAAGQQPLKPLDADKLAAWHAAEAARPFHVGVWCAYGETLLPNNGIGVFAYNLVDGLLAHPDRPDVTVVCFPGDEHLLDEVVERSDGRVRVVPTLTRIPLPQPGPTAGERLAAPVRAAVRGLVGAFRWTRRKVVGPSRRLVDDYPLLLLPALPFVLPFVYTKAALHPAAALLRRLSRYADVDRRPPAREDVVTAHQVVPADVWVYPAPQLEWPTGEQPAVVFVHDLVWARFPEYFDPHALRVMERAVKDRVADAALVACMSEFIRGNDLLGLLGLPEDKVRMVRPAPPADFPDAAPSVAHLRPSGRPFLLYPAGLRGYKNHGVLVDALAALKAAGQDLRLDLVFTSGGEDKYRRELLARAERLGLADRVQVLGRVTREELAGLYQEAFATVVPSLYEQGSFPLYEALHYGCPVAAADIPSLREQCDGLGDAMLYFDPLDPAAVAAALRTLAARREPIRQAQVARGRALWDRTWPEVAALWLGVFREAADKYVAPPPQPAPALPAGGVPRIGVWMDYGGTFRPHEGIGVHVHSLLNGFLDLPEPVELVLAGRWGDEAPLAELVRRGAGRVRVLPGPHQRLADPVAVAQRAGCHLWVMPYVGYEGPVPKPAAVILHDMVTAFRPGEFDPHFVSEIARQCKAMTDATAAVVCLGHTLADAEARQELRLPEHKVRVIRPAATALPPDGEPADDEVLAGLKRPFLFYPGAFRGYKNHTALLHALRILREEHGRADLDVVFTGAKAELPADLAGVPGAAGLKAHIHVLGRVNRATLDELYRRAEALAFPSFYEGYGLPVFEAVALGCPVLCADLPVFREHLAPLGDSVLYFRPDQPRTLVRAVLHLRAHRAEVLAAQQALKGGVLDRTWADVAGEWVALARELADEAALPPVLPAARGLRLHTDAA